MAKSERKTSRAICCARKRIPCAYTVHQLKPIEGVECVTYIVEQPAGELRGQERERWRAKHDVAHHVVHAAAV